MADTCEGVGMRAVCNGDYTCHWSSGRCQVVELESDHCGMPMRGISLELCSEEYPSNCPQLEGLFNYLNGYYECGIVRGSYCDDYISKQGRATK